MDKHVIEVEARFTDNVTAGAKKADKALDSLEKKAKKSTSVKMNFNPNTTKLDKMLSKLDQFAGKAKSGFKVTVSVVDQATSRLNRISSAGARIAGKTWRATVKIADYATRPLRGILSALTSVQALIAGVATGAAVNYGVVKPVSLSDQIKQLNMAFSTQLGGDAAAQSFMNEIYAFDKKSPFDTMQIAQQAQLMLNTGWQRDEILPDLSNIGDWAAAMGKGEAGISSVVMALGQMRQKGRVYAEEMLQLTEAGVSGWEYLAQSLGVSTAQVREMVEDGAVSVDDAVRGIIGGMSEFAGTAERTANETISGMMDQIGTTLKMGVALPWGEGLSEGFGDGLQYLKQQLVDNDDQLTEFGENARQIGIQIGEAFSNFAINGIDKVKNILNDPEFQSLSIGGKIKFAWDELIAEPFSAWWDASGKEMVTQAGKDFASWLWEGITSALAEFAESHPIITTILAALGASKAYQAFRDFFPKSSTSGIPGLGGSSNVAVMRVNAGVVHVSGGLGDLIPDALDGAGDIAGGVVEAIGSAGIASALEGAVKGALGGLSDLTVNAENVSLNYDGDGGKGGENSLNAQIDNITLESSSNMKLDGANFFDELQKMVEEQEYEAVPEVTVFPEYIYEDTELDPTEMGDGWSLEVVPNVTVTPNYSYNTSGFSSSALAPSSISVSPTVSVNPVYEYSGGFSGGGSNGRSSGGFSGGKAAGGIVSKYGTYTLAEEGTPEAVIPLGAQRRSRGVELWEQTGRMLGMGNFSADGKTGEHWDEATYTVISPEFISAAFSAKSGSPLASPDIEHGMRNLPVMPDGGLISKFGTYTLAEEGTPEMVIPLGAHRRSRGVKLWEQAGNMLGIPGFFNGGIAGDGDKAVGASQYVTPEVGGGDTDNSISISLGGVNIQVTGATGDVIEEIRARAAEAADIVAGEFIKVARVMAQNSPRRA